MELLLGCGNRREKIIKHGGVPQTWTNLTTLDIDEGTGCHVAHDLRNMPMPFDDDMFNEIHAYEVLEHCGSQGDWRLWLNQWEEFHRIAKPGALFCGTVPMWNSPWAWGDPGHSRVITQGTLLMLSQKLYDDEVGKTAITDYRPFYKGDWVLLADHEFEHTYGFVLKAIK